jgi:thymidine phosphorylase
VRAFEKKLRYDSTAGNVAELKASRAGYISRCDARSIGELIRDLGGGRLTKESAIDYDVGIDRMRKPGEWVERGWVLARIHARSAAEAKDGRERLAQAFEIAAQKPRLGPLIAGIVK